MKFNLKNFIECVPNFSEGRDRNIIQEIVSSIESSENVYLLGVDSGISANRTVVTFVGPPESVYSAAFQAYKTAYEKIDMSKQTGNHPRIGALDVCPFVPFEDTQMAACIEISERLAKKVGNELEVPVYLYGYSAKSPGRIALPSIRKGGCENLARRITHEKFMPDHGPPNINPRFGATVIGARNILIAYNVNLADSDLEMARAIAKEVRNSKIAFSNSNTGKESKREKTVRAIGWFVEEYDCCQVSMNLTNYKQTSIRQAFDLVKNIAGKYNIAVSGSELVGLAPTQALVPEWDPNNLSEIDKTLNKSIDYLGLNRCYPFERDEKIIEYRLNSLIDN